MDATNVIRKNGFETKLLMAAAGNKTRRGQRRNDGLFSASNQLQDSLDHMPFFGRAGQVEESIDLVRRQDHFMLR